MMADVEKPIHELRFDAAVKVIQSLPPNGSFQPSNEMMLKFYSYYKQATQGPCSIPRPGFWDPVGKVKWDAWNGLGDMPREEAMAAYVEELKLILESMPVTDEVEELLQILGPFYEVVDDKKKITQVSDLNTGFGTLMTAPSRSVTKSIIRTMTMNGTIDSHTKKVEPIKSQTKAISDEDEEDDEDDEDEEEVKEVKKAPLPKKKMTAKASMSNGNISHSEAPLTNGTLSSNSKSVLNGVHSKEEQACDSVPEEIQELNGDANEPKDDGNSGPHLASDSDSEVYCDSVDQFGAEEGSEVHTNHSLDLREESPSTLSSLEELGSQERDSEEPVAEHQGVQHGGEDWKASGNTSERHRPNTDQQDGSLVRRSRGSRSPACGSGAPGPLQGGGGDGDRWGTEGASGGDLNEQIVVALARLQEDMQSVLERLHTLEALTATQARSLALPSNYLTTPAKTTKKKPSWWPFEVSPGTVAFAVIWPFVVQWLIRLYAQRRRRKIN